MPNALGRTLKYFFDAVSYARGDAAKSAQARNPLSNRILLNASYAANRSSSTAAIEAYAQMAATNTAYAAAAERIGNRIASSDNFKVQMRDGDEWEDDKDHQFLTVLRAPNSFVPGNLLMQEAALNMNMHGNAYWYLVTDYVGMGPVREIWPLMPSRAYPDPLTLRRSAITGRLTIDYRYNLGSPVLLPGENVVHFRTPNLFDYWQGMSKLTSIQGALKMDMGESQYLSSFFEEGNAIPNAIISVPSQLTDQELRMVQRDIQEQFGARRATAVARAGDMDVEILQHSIEEMQVLQGMSFNDKRIRDAMGVPEGLSNASSGTARLAAEIAFAKDVIQPMLNSMAAFLNTTVTPLYASPHQMQIVAENVIPQDSAVEIAEYSAYRDDDTINGNRKSRGLQPLKLSGALAKYQPFLDEVPVELVHDLLGAEASAASGESASSGGQDGSYSSLVAALSGVGATNLAGGNANASQRAGFPPSRRPKRVHSTTQPINNDGISSNAEGNSLNNQ